MATIRLVPSTYAVSNTSYVTVTNDSDMYNNTEHSSNYATLRGRAGRSNNSTYYAFINGFNFNAVPSNATVTGFTVKIKAYRGSYLATGNTNYRICLASQASNSYQIGNTTLSEDITTSTTGVVYTIPTGSLTWSQIVGYGSGFSIDIPLRNSSTSSSNYPYVYVYGAEIEVNYTIPIYHSISFNNESQSVTTVPSTTLSLSEDENQTIEFYGITNLNSVIVKDNDVDITSNLVPITNITTTFNPSSFEDYSGYSIAGQGSGCTDTNSTTYCSLNLRQQTNAYVLYSFDTSAIPLDATINSVSCSAKVSVSTGSTNITGKTVQLYAGSTAKGTAYTNITTSTTVFDITADNNWTAEEVRNIKIRAGASCSRSNNYYLRFYGANLTINYTVNETFYTYTISNIQADHTITISDVLTSNKLYMKMDSMNTFITSAYSSNYDVNNLIAYVQNGAIVAGDTVLVSFTNLRRWYSGQGVSLGTFSFAFERTNTIGSWAYHYVSGNTGPGVRIQQLTAGSQLLIYPYDSRQTNAEYDGKIEVYKVTSVDGWVEMLGVFMKVNGAWVAQDISDELFYDNTVYMKN